MRTPLEDKKYAFLVHETAFMDEGCKIGKGTNINLAEKRESQNKELALVQERDLLKEKLLVLNQDRANKPLILNVISDFPTQGIEQKGFWKSYKFLLPLAWPGVLLFFLGTRGLNSYLKSYNSSK